MHYLNFLKVLEKHGKSEFYFIDILVWL
jgi:hypothetical protein